MRLFRETSASDRPHRPRITTWTRLFLAIGALAVVQSSVATRVGAADVTVSPQRVTLAPGAQQRFTAATNGNGRVHWRATGGTISGGGVYTAGSEPGSFTVTASRANASDTATVVIVEPAPAPEPRPTPAPAPGPTPAPAPLGSVAIYAGDNIQAAVNARAAGTVFVIKAGVHRRQSVRPKDGTSFIGEPGAILDGENATPRAFIGEETKNVTVRGLRITRYVPPDITAALDAIDSYGWIVENNEIDNNSNGSARSYGLRIGHRMTVRGNKIHHNGWVGISGYLAVDTLIEGNEIYANPAKTFNDTIGEASNVKLFACGRIIFRNNHVHDGPFRGVWFDTSQPDITIEDNRIVNHGDTGIWYEVSYRGTIRKNYVENAGSSGFYGGGWLRAGGIQVTNSSDVSVIENTVLNSLNGIIGQQANTYVNEQDGKSQLRNLLVEGNTVVMARGQTGLIDNAGNNMIYVSANNRFVGNRYELKGNPTPFYWMGRDLDEYQWQAFRQDGSATFTR
jgi:parallel beta-helix repeat protein